MTDRPTFHESWYRVAELRPRLRGVVQVFRQDYRGRAWHVLRDPGNNQFYRLDEPAYHFVGLLDGRRTVAQAWDQTGEVMGDSAPTQGEAIQLLGQLYTSNLLTAELPADAEGMFDRYKKRINRQVGGYLMNIMFARIPLIDPERFLEKWKPATHWVFGPVGIALWLVMLGVGLFHLAGRGDELFSRTQGVLAPENIFFLYAAFVIAKVIHELGHAFAVKRFGRSERVEAEVHTIGIMLLVLMPVPYVDATASWAFRSKWRRAFVAAAGMYLELFVAAVAAVVWARTDMSTPLQSAIHAISYNVMFIAGVSTVLFNANPLIRFDGYYILSDLTETPNLYQRSNDYLKYLVKKYIYRVRRPRNPGHTTSEKTWLTVYGLTSTVYRVFLFAGILWFVADQLFFVGTIMAAMSIIAWLFVPLGKWIKYLLTDAEVERTRGQSILASVLMVGVPAAALGYIPVPDHGRVPGTVEPARYEVVFAQSDGFITDAAPTLTPADNALLLSANDPEKTARRDELRATLRRLVAEQRKQMTEDPAGAQIVRAQVEAVRASLDRVSDEIERMSIVTTGNGQWVAPDADRYAGAWFERGKPVGVVATLDDLIIRAAADQTLGPVIEGEGGWIGRAVTLKAPGHAQFTYEGTVLRISPAGMDTLPSPALGYAAGGPIATDMSDAQGGKTTEPYFEVRIKPHAPPVGAPPLMPGQRVTVRFAFEQKPLLEQGWLLLRQLFQKRFGV